MSPLRNVKHEAFCQLTFEGARYGWSQGLCYVKAGFKATGHAAETSASRLLKKDDIQRRLAELGGGGAKKARVTAEHLVEKLDTVFDGAVADKQYSAAGRAVEVQGKITGVLRDRVEIGSPGSFDDLQTPADVVARLLDENEPAQLIELFDQMRALVLQQAADRAVVVDETPLAPRLGDEFERSLALFRPAEKGKRRRT